MRERGLKRLSAWRMGGRVNVAPHAGAWIETWKELGISKEQLSLPMRERGLKRLSQDRLGKLFCRSPCGSVD